MDAVDIAEMEARIAELEDQLNTAQAGELEARNEAKVAWQLLAQHAPAAYDDAAANFALGPPPREAG